MGSFNKEDYYVVCAPAPSVGTAWTIFGGFFACISTLKDKKRWKKKAVKNMGLQNVSEVEIKHYSRFYNSVKEARNKDE